MFRGPGLSVAWFVWLGMVVAGRGQPRPYIGYAYPAGGQQGTVFQIRLGGQNLDDVQGVLITGAGVQAEVVEYRRRLNAQELQLLNEELRELKRAAPPVAATRTPLTKPTPVAVAGETALAPAGQGNRAQPEPGEATPELIAKLEQRVHEFVPLPASDSIANLVIARISIAPEAEPGDREIRLVTPRGVSNPLVFEVGQLREFARKPMITASKPVLGKEEQALRQRPPGEAEDRVVIPCTLNGQMAAGEVNSYRFAARRGQRLVIATHARHLVPFLADAVPGWFQAVEVLYDDTGKEVAYDDDYRYDPDPVIFYPVPRDGQYVLAIYDSLHRGREDFVYRTTISELPFITSLFPLGAKAGAPVTPRLAGWNLEHAVLRPLEPDARPGIHRQVASRGGLFSNRLPFALDTLAEVTEKEPNNTRATAQRVVLPVVINGRIDRPGDWDVFQFTGRSNQTIVAEVQARRLGSPLDSIIKLTDATGRVLAFNDDYESLGAGVNTHQADSYLRVTLPTSGTYYVHLGDIARHGGPAYGYRLRLSAPRPDFDLFVVPTSVALRTNGAASVTAYVARKDGFDGPVRLGLRDPPPGFSAFPVTLRATQSVARLTFRGPRTRTDTPVNLTFVGTARIGGREILHPAVPAEDRMQAFLWRHLVAAADFKVMVFDPGYEPPSKGMVRGLPPSTAVLPNPPDGLRKNGSATRPAAAASATPPRFTKQQVAARLRQLKRLFEDGLLTPGFYAEQVAQCAAAN
ncbi:MAG: hypothetical protein KGS61_13610 [Verrucomicrobia bacterium]|nr:hypothetical protein [Verrucomicrobiota bacterium]